MLLVLFCFQIALLGSMAHATTYYLSPSGNDANNGLSSSRPWLTPNHAVACGDVILATPSTSYYSENFNSGKWGTVSCSGKNNVAWLQCQTFDGCKINSTTEGINVDQNYWGVQGWEVTTSAGSNGFCFGAAPTRGSTIHHVIFANNIANGCQAGGFVVYNAGSTAGVDYIAIIGNIAYNAIQGNKYCYTGISIFQPVQSDSAAGTHIYIAGNFTWANRQPSPCGGVQAWGGDGIILDTLDGSEGLSKAYTAQVLVDNNIAISNGGHGLEVQNNIAGSAHALIYLRHNTLWGNENDSAQQKNYLCAESLLNSAYNVRELYNLAATEAPNACANNPNYALSAYTVNSTVWVYNNFAYASNNQNTWVWNGPGFSYASNNTLGQSPYFKNAVQPGAPSCGGKSSVANCMAGVVSNFTATNSSASGTGYQVPSSTSSYDALFPQWVCNVNVPAGLITKGC